MKFDEILLKASQRDTAGNLVATLPQIVAEFDNQSELDDDLFGLMLDPLFVSNQDENKLS